ncbi:MAG: hypothetical protein M3495_01540 [Pseudomonadota bacterium]|nr:hypothetical protein [Pseudomonadota bacterium]
MQARVESPILYPRLAGAWEEATTLEYLRFDDVAPDLKLPEDHAVTTLRTFDGLVAIVKSAIVKDKTRASVGFFLLPV